MNLDDNVETLRRMVNANITEFNERGGGSPVALLAVFGAMLESFLKNTPEEYRQRMWDNFKKTMEQRVRLK